MKGPSRSAAVFAVLAVSALVQPVSPRPHYIDVHSFVESHASGESVCMIRVLDAGGLDAFLLSEQRLLAVNRFFFAPLHEATGVFFYSKSIRCYIDCDFQVVIVV